MTSIAEASHRIMAETARQLRKQGVKQVEIAQLLEVTAACVSQYIQNERVVDHVKKDTKTNIEWTVQKYIAGETNNEDFAESLVEAIAVEVTP